MVNANFYITKMTYKDIILKLLNSREDLVCMEDHLMNDFRENGKSNISFDDWCQKHKIVCLRVCEGGPQKLRLKKAELLLK